MFIAYDHTVKDTIQCQDKQPISSHMACGTKQCNRRITYFRDAYLNTCDPILFSVLQ